MTSSKRSGIAGEDIAKQALTREGWDIVADQVDIDGHLIDFIGIHPVTNEEWLIEVKSWGPSSGRDTVKKAIADAYDFQQLGQSRPYMLVLSHFLPGLLGDMLRRARKAGAIHDIRVLGSRSEYDEDE